MERFDANMAALEKSRPLMYKKLKEIIDEGGYVEGNIEEVDARDGGKALVVTAADGVKYRLNSPYRPYDEAKRWASQYKFNNIDISVMMFGMGNLIFVREMLKNLQKDAAVYLYEPDISIFIYNIYNNDMEDVISDMRTALFVGGINTYEFKSVIQSQTDWIDVSTQITCCHPIYEKAYPKEYKNFLKDVRDVLVIHESNRNTLRHLSVASANNILKNLVYIRESNYVSEFVGKIPEDVPAIIVAAGPSLDKNIDELKRAKGKAFIFATDTSVKYLLAHGVSFDAMITIDSKKSIRHLSDERCYGVPLFTVIEAKSEFMAQHTGRKIWFFSSGAYMAGLYRKHNKIFPEYSTGGSVATAAFSICVTFGIKNIILIGQDLAYLGDASYAGGIASHHVMDEDKTLVDGVNGDKVYTRGDWIIYRDWFEQAIGIKERLGFDELIDATEGGALIHGSKVMKLSDAIDEYCVKDFSFKDVIDAMPYTFSEEEYEKVREDMLHLKKEFNNIRQKSNEGIKATNELLSMMGAPRRDERKEEKNLKIINKANRFMEKQPVYEIFDMYISGDVVDVMSDVNRLTDDEDANMKKTLEISKNVYKSMIRAADALEPVLDESLGKI